MAGLAEPMTGMVGRHRDLEILGASLVLDDALAVIGPPVDAEREVILCHRCALSRLGAVSGKRFVEWDRLKSNQSLRVALH